MDLSTLERAAYIVFAMCEQHPEICPHDYEWEWSKTNENIKEEHYKCKLCGKEFVKLTKI